MNLYINGIGVWGFGLRSWSDFTDIHAGLSVPDQDDSAVPSPKAIPPRERRRAPLPVKLAVEVAQQACDQAGVNHAAVASVFTSAMGDTAITDCLCRILASPDKMVSPTKFHNSVHNAASGYWSIAAKNRSASSFIGGFAHSFPVALLEAAIQCHVEECPVLLVANDIAHSVPFTDIIRIESNFACGLLLDRTPSVGGWSLSISNQPGHVDWPKPAAPAIAHLGELNPCARALTVMDACAGKRATELRMPLNEHAHLELKVSASTVI
jgi:hypothetical protein